VPPAGTENLADARQYSWTGKEPNTVEAETEFSAWKSVLNLQSTTPFELSGFLVCLDFGPSEAKSILTARKRNLFRDSSLNNIEF